MSEPKIIFNRLFPDVPDNFEPSSHKRDWMDEIPGKFAYRCVPMTVANSLGWIFRCPYSFEATWDGGTGVECVKVINLEDREKPSFDAYSHFGSGILTFAVNYILQTSDGWGVWVRGLPNSHKDGITPLDGFVETDWVPFTFTMSWRFTEPGTIKFEKGEPYCFISMMYYKGVSSMIPEVRNLKDGDPAYRDDFIKYSTLRREFNFGLQTRNKKATKKGSQKFYLHGQSPGAISAPEHHSPKLRMKSPLEIKDNDE